MQALLAADNPLDHVVDHPVFGPVTLHMITLFVASGLLVAGMLHVASRIRRGAGEGVGRYIPAGRLAQGIEAVCVYFRDEIARPQLGEQTDRFIGFIWTVFFFILTCNLLGLVPIIDLQHLLGLEHAVVGGTATGNLAVTAALALVVFVVVQANSFATIGPKAWAQHFTAGAPVFLWPIMIPVEIMGTFIKPFALAVRLFANMVAGHTLLATILMFTKLSLSGMGLLGGGAISLLAFVAAVPLMFLELLVAFVQAFIFTLLTVVFIGQLSHHDEHEHDEHAHEETPGASEGRGGAEVSVVSAGSA